MNLKKIKQLEAEARPGPWEVKYHPGRSKETGSYVDSSDDNGGDDLEDDLLIVEMRNQLPSLIAAVEEAREAMKEIADSEDKTNLGSCCVDKLCVPYYGDTEQLHSCSFQFGVNRGFSENAPIAKEWLEKYGVKDTAPNKSESVQDDAP